MKDKEVILEDGEQIIGFKAKLSAYYKSIYTDFQFKIAKLT
jgi:hypothetical protein